MEEWGGICYGVKRGEMLEVDVMFLGNLMRSCSRDLELVFAVTYKFPTEQRAGEQAS